jgi:pimeloyl-ACP methyl ester carboxylesterase
MVGGPRARTTTRIDPVDPMPHDTQSASRPPEILTLRDGRRLEVRQYGDPSGHPAFFFHGMIGSYHQASFIADEAARRGLRIIAPNRPGVVRSEFVARKTPLEVVEDVEDMATAFRLDRFSLIGISGGTPYVLATLRRLSERVRTATIMSGMGPIGLPGGLQGMRRSHRMGLEVGSRFPGLALRNFCEWAARFRANPTRFLDGFVAGSCQADRVLFRGRALYETFLQDMHQVFEATQGPESLAQELGLYRNHGFALEDLPDDRCVTLWQGLDDDVVPPSMAFAMLQRLPNREGHFVPGGHFVAASIADRVIARLVEQLEDIHP